jgi:hypothetical protein
MKNLLTLRNPKCFNAFGVSEKRPTIQETLYVYLVSFFVQGGPEKQQKIRLELSGLIESLKMFPGA